MSENKIKYYKEKNGGIIRREGKFGIADPCNVIPNNLWSDFLDKCGFNLSLGDIGKYEGLKFECLHLGDDGCYFGVPVDAGIVTKFDFLKVKNKFKLELEEMELKDFEYYLQFEGSEQEQEEKYEKEQEEEEKFQEELREEREIREREDQIEEDLSNK